MNGCWLGVALANTLLCCPSGTARSTPRLPSQPTAAACRAPAPQIADLMAAGKVKLEVALSVPLAEAARAHEQVATSHTRGKVVLTV